MAKSCLLNMMNHTLSMELSMDESDALHTKK